MKRRLIALCLALVVLGSLCTGVLGADAVRRYDSRQPDTKDARTNGYVYPTAESEDPVFVKGRTVMLSFKRRMATPSTSDSFIVQIYRGYSEDLRGGTDLPLVESRTYKMSQFTAPNYLLTISISLDSRYSAGNYTVLWGVRSSAGKQYSSDYDWVMDMQVVSSEIPATGVTLYSREGTNTGTIDVGETIILSPGLLPENSTTPRNFTVTSSQPGVATVTMNAGFVQVHGVAVGDVDITVRCGNLSKTFSLGVGSLSDFTLTPGKTSLCIGTTDTIRTNANTGGKPAFFTWTSSDPSVATVNGGVVTGIKPGTATISAYCYGITRSVTYRINYHQLPADTPVSTRTATCPRQSIGRCSVCGKENCVNVFEPAIFTDTVYNAWYSKHVDYVYDNGLMNGTGEHTFAPSSPVTRGMVVTVLYRIAGEPAVAGGSAFLDVPAGKYYSNAVIWAQGLGVVKGFQDGTYRPNENVTREQLAAILYRFTQANGEPISGYANLVGFPDANQVHNYALQPMAWAVAEGIITGVGKDGRDYLQPANSATRAQFATIISRYLQRG